MIPKKGRKMADQFIMNYIIEYYINSKVRDIIRVERRWITILLAEKCAAKDLSAL